MVRFVVGGLGSAFIARRNAAGAVQTTASVTIAAGCRFHRSQFQANVMSPSDVLAQELDLPRR